MMRTIDMNSSQMELFKDLRKDLNRGFLPAALLNPLILAKHNSENPPVAHITNESQKVSLDSLLLMYVEDGREARQACKNMLYDSTHKKPSQEQELPVRHDPKTAKVHVILDELED